MYLHQKQRGASSSLICMNDERLQYHLPNQQMVLFDDDDDDDVQEVVAWSAIFRTMLAEWFKTN
jgi:hypothetical protein